MMFPLLLLYNWISYHDFKTSKYSKFLPFQNLFCPNNQASFHLSRDRKLCQSWVQIKKASKFENKFKFIALNSIIKASIIIVSQKNNQVSWLQMSKCSKFAWFYNHDCPENVVSFYLCQNSSVKGAHAFSFHFTKDSRFSTSNRIIAK